MRTLGLTFVVALVVAFVPFVARAQIVAPQACAASLACQQQRIADLVDYRAFLEDQLALAKSLVRELQQQLQQKDAALQACEKK